MNDPVRAAEAVLLSARLNEMSSEYAPALTPAPHAPFKSINPLREKAALVGCALTNARAIGGGMCEFDAITLICGDDYCVHCIAPARVAIHIRYLDVFEIVGTICEGERGFLFDVEAVHGTR
jgi:hypothetical protein